LIFRAKQFLNVLKNVKIDTENFVKSKMKSKESVNEIDYEYKTIISLIPSDDNEIDILLRWSYYEAEILIKQYGEILDDLRGYINTGSSNVAECIHLIDEELT
jgi:hypothetical protein